MSEWLSLTAFLGTADSEVHVVHIGHKYSQDKVFEIGGVVPWHEIHWGHHVFLLDPDDGVTSQRENHLAQRDQVILLQGRVP